VKRPGILLESRRKDSGLSGMTKLTERILPFTGRPQAVPSLPD
jgi:hypothetical protein